MSIYSVFIINKAGGLIYHHDQTMPKIETEKTFSFPLDLVLKSYDEKIVVAFGQRDDIKVGHTVLAINGAPTVGKCLDDGREILDVLSKEENYPISIKFGKPKLTTNEKIMLAGMFHSLFAIAVQLSPIPKSSGIHCLETDTFKLHCFQTLTGIKFLVLTDPRLGSQDALLKKIYEVYSDFALKNPFYNLEMPIRCELFDINLQSTLEQTEKLNAAS